jgi:hypothetical protein
MKRIIIATIAIVILIGGVITALILTKSSTNKSSNAAPTVKLLPTASLTACDVLTKEAAASLLGNNIQKKDSIADTSSNDISTTTCTYVPNVDPAKGISKLSAAQVLARVAKTAAAAKSNIEAFNATTKGVQNVAGIGDKAFYNPDFKQLDVLKNGNWYLITYYTDFLGQSADLNGDLQLAHKLNLK